MSNGNAIRAWFGWRVPQMTRDDNGFVTFTRELAETFVPATWLVMHKYGLLAYVPTLLRKDKAAHVPDEIALLVYASEGDYNAHKLTVAGRSYGVMHRALFDFDMGPRRSRSDWTDKLNSEKLRAHRRARKEGGCSFDDPDAITIVVVLDGPAPQAAPEATVFQAVGYPDCEAVVVCERGLTVVWLAAPQGTQASAVSQGLQAAFGNHVAVVAAHEATPVSLHFADPDQKHPSDEYPAVNLGPDQSIRIVD